MAEITQWIEGHQALVQQIGSFSLIVLAVTVVALPVVVIKLPQDYFTVEKREPASQTRKQPLLWAVLSLLKKSSASSSSWWGSPCSCFRVRGPSPS